jgi:hypothetical protein
LDNAHKATPTNLVRLVDVWCPCCCILTFSFPLAVCTVRPCGTAALYPTADEKLCRFDTGNREGNRCYRLDVSVRITDLGRSREHELGVCESRFARILLRFCQSNSRGRVTEARSKLKRGGLSPYCPIFTSSSYSFWFPSFFSHILPLISMEFLAVGVLAPARFVPVLKACCGPGSWFLYRGNRGEYECW